MKKAVSLIVIFLTICFCTFAKDKAIFKKQTTHSFIGLYQSNNLKETDGFKYYIVIQEDDFEGGILLYTIVCNDYEKIKNFLTENYKAGNKLEEPLFAFYPYFYSISHDDLTLKYENTEIDSVRNALIEQRIYILQ